MFVSFYAYLYTCLRIFLKGNVLNVILCLLFCPVMYAFYVLLMRRLHLERFEMEACRIGVVTVLHSHVSHCRKHEDCSASLKLSSRAVGETSFVTVSRGKERQ